MKFKMEKQLKHISKFMSLVLRHRPEEIGLTLDENGWANVEELINRMNAKGADANKAIIELIVATNDKKRFAFNEDKTMIRASQGHSIEVELDLQPTTAPDLLYHGTAERSVAGILQSGIQKQSRQHVHLSETIETAKAVGSRHGRPVIFIIDAKQMQADGLVFYLSANKVWLSDDIPSQYITQ